MSNKLILFFFLVILVFAIPSFAGERIISYSGILTDSQDTPINTKTAMTFRIYTSSIGGEAIWSETNAVQVRIGATIHGVNRGRRVNRQVTGIVELELRLQQSSGSAVRCKEYEIGILSSSWIELQRTADIGA